ncbi:MAG TPA: hypothetical protein PK251_14430 [Candidatus Latescibacteria bacterium]|nr:hypothetical protein [Candidatus Latescibacterota bacterium]HPK75375.1 hypothetical protein [Candidatus Latescibacterota bacterium]
MKLSDRTVVSETGACRGGNPSNVRGGPRISQVVNSRGETAQNSVTVA